MCSPGKRRTRTRSSTWCKRKCDSSDQATFFHCSVVQFWCSRAHCWPLWRWTGVSMGTLTGLRLCNPIRNKLMNCVFWHLSIRTSINFLSNSSYSSSSVFVHHWASATHDPVAGSPLFLPWTTFDRYWPLQTGNTPQELQFWRCSDHHNLVLVKLTQILTPAHFSCL